LADCGREDSADAEQAHIRGERIADVRGRARGGDEVTECLTRLARDERLSAAQISAIGAFETATLAFWDWERKEYEKIPVREPVEVLPLADDMAVDETEHPKLHLHAVLGRRDHRRHLLEARVRPTLEVIVR
jgi:uncharacterized protein